MAQIFSRSADTGLRLVLAAVFLAMVGSLLGVLMFDRSDYRTQRGWVVDQPIPFSHAHHAGDLGIDCRYCHASVETSAEAGLPPTHTCMGCHSQLFTDADVLAPLRASLAQDRPLHWKRVVQLPDYVYFHHAVHVQAGVGCVSCHGRVDRMPLLTKAEPLNMGQCLDCHRDPAPNLRPREEVTNMAWAPSTDRRAMGEQLMQGYHIDIRGLTDCAVCHR